MNQPSLVFVIRGGAPVLLHPFTADSGFFGQLGSQQPEGRIGINMDPSIMADFQKGLYSQAEKAFRKFMTGKRFYLRFAVSVLIFVVTYLFLSIVIRDPVPLIDELLLSFLASLSYYLLDERRILTAVGTLGALGTLKSSLDRIFFHESRIVSIVETWREELILLGPGSFYRNNAEIGNYALMEDDVEEAEVLCSMLSARWKHLGLLQRLYTSMQEGRQPVRLVDALVRKLGLDEAALALSYLKLLKALEQRRISL